MKRGLRVREIQAQACDVDRFLTKSGVVQGHLHRRPLGNEHPRIFRISSHTILARCVALQKFPIAVILTFDYLFSIIRRHDVTQKMMQYPAVTGENFVGDQGTVEGPDAAREHFFHGFTKLHRDISQVRKPTIAMINGPAVGSGMDMALHCDIRLGCENTRFIGYQQLGQIVENGGSYYLPKMAGLGRALEFAYTGHLDAQRAYDWGLLNYLVESEKLEETTRALCDRIMRTPPMVQWISKRIMRASVDSNLETTMVLTSNAGGILNASDDAREARAAFLEKRAPSFKGR